MTAPHDLDRQLQAFLIDGPNELPDSSFDAVRDRIESTRQRVVIGPWRMPDMNKFVPLGLGAAAAVVALVLGAQLLASPAPSGPGSSSSAAPSVTAEPSVAAPSPTSATPPPLTETFISERYGFSMSYPTGWVARPATGTWTESVPDYISTAGDVVYDPVREASLWIVVASRLIGDSAPEAWVAETLALDDGCTATKPVAVDGAPGSMGVDGCTRAAVTVDGRGYFIWLYTSGDEPSLSVTYGQAWFEDFLATVQLQPGDALDGATSVSP